MATPCPLQLNSWDSFSIFRKETMFLSDEM